MKLHIKALPKGIPTQFFILGLSLLDDALFLLVSRLGLHLTWLHNFSPVIMTCMVLYTEWQCFYSLSNVEQII